MPGAHVATFNGQYTYTILYMTCKSDHSELTTWKSDHFRLALAYLFDLTIHLLLAIVEDGPLGISATGSHSIEIGAHMRSTEALEIVTIVEHRRLLIPLTRMAWALYLRDVLAHVVWLGTTTAL